MFPPKTFHITSIGKERFHVLLIQEFRRLEKKKIKQSNAVSIARDRLFLP